MFSWYSTAFLGFVFFRKLRECYTKEATSTSYFCLLLLFCYCLPGSANLPSSCWASGLAGNINIHRTRCVMGPGLIVTRAAIPAPSKWTLATAAALWWRVNWKCNMKWRNNVNLVELKFALYRSEKPRSYQSAVCRAFTLLCNTIWWLSGWRMVCVILSLCRRSSKFRVSFDLKFAFQREEG